MKPIIAALVCIAALIVPASPEDKVEKVQSQAEFLLELFAESQQSEAEFQTVVAAYLKTEVEAAQT